MSNVPNPVPAVEADPKRPWKAYVATALTAVAAFVTYWIADPGTFDAKDVGEAFLAALVASGLTGVGTYSVRNPKVVRR